MFKKESNVPTTPVTITELPKSRRRDFIPMTSLFLTVCSLSPSLSAISLFDIDRKRLISITLRFRNHGEASDHFLPEFLILYFSLRTVVEAAVVSDVFLIDV